VLTAGNYRSVEMLEDASQSLAPVYAPVSRDEDEYRPEPVPAPKPPAWCDGSMRIGIHTSIAGDIAGSLESARKLGCNALQIFSASPRMWPRAGSRLPAADAERFRARRAELGLGPLVIHANYLINLASADPVMRVRTIQAFHDELVRATALGADFLVVHPGAARGASAPEAIRSVAEALRQAARGVRLAKDFADRSQGGVRVLLENTSGMGSCLGSSFEELRAILDQAPELPLGVCIDTAHAFEAGYDLRSEKGLEKMVADVDAAVGLGRVPVVHTNDSKTALGSRVDRHQHIGRGYIGRPAFGRILTHPRLSVGGASGLAGRAFILETPVDAPGDDRRNVRALWELAGVPVKQAPRAENGFSMQRKSGVVKTASKGRRPKTNVKMQKNKSKDAKAVKSRGAGRG
jgi:deoxyribonuclease IV